MVQDFNQPSSVQDAGVTGGVGMAHYAHATVIVDLLNMIESQPPKIPLLILFDKFWGMRPQS